MKLKVLKEPILSPTTWWPNKIGVLLMKKGIYGIFIVL